MKHNQLYNLNSSFENYPTNKLILEFFDEQVKSAPNQIAIYCEDEQITYEELDKKSTLLAHHLKQIGVHANTPIALYLERSPRLIIAILAIVKASGAYVPLDIQNPAERNKYILSDSNPILFISCQTNLNSLQKFIPPSVSDKILLIDDFFEKKTLIDYEPIEYSNLPDDLLYIMYTSGSTGFPKGCMIPHRAVIRLVKNTNYVSISPHDKIAQIANIAFDAFTFEMWGALLNGATLSIIPQKILLSPSDFSKSLKSNKISIIFITTALFNLICRNVSDAFDECKYLLFGGEKANSDIVNSLLERKKNLGLENLNIVHVYGPTENTTFSTALVLDNESIENNQVPIGFPISHTQAYVLDNEFKNVAPGVIAELYLAGDGLALGYLNDKELTVSKFINSPWSETENLYKTGDLVYESDHHGLIFVGRIDTQIKIRGFRVELTEIETCILRYPNITQAVVINNPTSYEEESLVAYICTTSAEKIDTFQLCLFLKQYLPRYMIPFKFITLDKIPLTANGKTDVRQLSQLDKINISTTNIPQILTSQIEKQISGILENILKEAALNPTENFFDLGINSLMLAEACTLLNERTGSIKKINIIDILNYPTIRTLAQHINNANEKNNFGTTILRAERKGRLIATRKNRHAH